MGDDPRAEQAGILRRLLAIVAIASAFITITAIVKPVAKANQHVAQSTEWTQSTESALIGDIDPPAPDQLQIQLAGGDTTHIPATLMSSAPITMGLATAITTQTMPTAGFHHQQSSWLKGFTPPP